MSSNTIAGRYRLDNNLSTTVMSEVWLATDSVLDRQVVVKLLAADADRARFEREARAVAALAHPNVVQLFDYGEDRGRPYMVLEYLPEGTLADRLPDGAPLEESDTRRIAVEIAAGLAHAHVHGVVHRDLKPGNVLFDAEERAKVGDFGIAQIHGTETITDEGTVLGTAVSMAPEQAAGEAVTPAADVYAFGVLLYRMLTGRFPFESENAVELARMHRDLEPPPVRSIRSDAPADLAALATAALEKDAAARPAHGAALVSALEGGGGGGARRPLLEDAATVLLPSFRRRRPGRLASLAAGMLILAAGIAVAAILVGSNSSAPAGTTGSQSSATEHRTQSTTTSSSSTTSTTPTTQPTTTRPGPATSTTVPLPLPPTSVVTTTIPITTGTTTAPSTTGP